MNFAIISWGNGLSAVRRQTIILSNTDKLSIRPRQTYSNDILFENQIVSTPTMPLKVLRTTQHRNIANFGYTTPQHREQTTRDDILIGTDLLGQLQSHVGERTSFSGVNPEKKTESGKTLEQPIAHCNR